MISNGESIEAGHTVVTLVPIHPGEILREEFLAPLGMSAGALALRLRVPRTRIERLMRETTGVTVDTALRLAKFFGSSPQFWMNLQASYDLSIEARRLENEIAAIPTLERAA